MAFCRFCDREFTNSQAVRAHLKGCVEYHTQRSPRSALGANPSGKRSSLGNSLGMAFTDADDGGDEPFDEQGKPLESAEPIDGQNRFTSVHDQHIVQNRDHHPTASPRKREIIQRVKQFAIVEIGAVLWPRPETKTDALQAIEQALVGLEVEEFPFEELMAIARNVRDRLYRSAERKEKEARDAEFLKQGRAQERAQRKDRLINDGIAYAKRELATVDELEGFARVRIELKVERELRTITGDEHWEEIQDIVEDIFAGEGIEDDDFGDDDE